MSVKDSEATADEQEHPQRDNVPGFQFQPYKEEPNVQEGYIL